MGLDISQRGAGLFLNFSVLGETQVSLALTGVLRRINDFRPIAPQIDEIIRLSSLKMFSAEGGDRFPWPDLAPGTVRNRIDQGFPGMHPILVRTGKLKRGMTQTGGDHYYRADAKFVESGVSVPYAIYHQMPGPHAIVPRRPFIYIDKRDVSQIVQVFRKYIMALDAQTNSPGKPGGA